MTPPLSVDVVPLKFPMIKVKRIDHVAIAVADRDGSAQSLSTLFGLLPGAREHVANQATDVAFLYAGHAGGTDEAALEICAPAGPTGNAAPGTLPGPPRAGPAPRLLRGR